MLTPEQIEKNWLIHLEYVDKYIADRGKKVKELYKDFEEIAILAPASSKTWYHNAFPGGYIDHVNRVIHTGLELAKLWKQTLGGSLDFTIQELVFSAMFHDLGKLGSVEGPNYLPQTDKWRQDKLKEVYTQNPELPFMLIPDRSLFLLQRYGIPVSQKEYLAIKLHDGVFDDANKAYFFSHKPESKLRTNLVHILHTADYIASKVEVDLYKKAIETPIKNTLE
jgi:hypothetical protein